MLLNLPKQMLAIVTEQERLYGLTLLYNYVTVHRIQ